MTEPKSKKDRQWQATRKPPAKPPINSKDKKMKKHKTPGLVPNKSMEIRKAARELVSQGKTPRPRDIVAQLKAKGIVTSSQQVSMALSNTEFAYRRNQEAQALGQVSIEDVFKAKKFVADLGTIEKAMAALAALKKFKGYTTPNAQQPPQMEENKDIRQNKTFIAEIQAAEQHRELITD